MPLKLSDRAAAVSPLPVLTAADAAALGIDLRSHRWRRLRKGVYVDAARFASLPPWERYAVRVHAYLRKHPHAVLCLESAAVVHGLPNFGETRWIHVYDAAARRSQAVGDVRIHASRMLREVQVVSGIAVTSLIDTVVDLARIAQPADALAVTDAALSPVQGGGVLLDDLIARGKDGPGTRGRLRMRWVWEHADGLSESTAESISRAVIEWGGYERPTLQRVFHYDGCTDRVDFLFESCAGIGEADGWGKYTSEAPDAAAQVLREEKRREDRLRRHGHPFARWEATDAWKVRPVLAALDAARIPRIRPVDHAMLATVRFRPRALPPAPAHPHISS